MLNDLRYRLRALFHRNQVERELEEELQFHLEQAAEKYGKSSESSEDRHRTARQLFGGVEQIREQCRDSRGTRWLEDFLQDCRYALRMMRKNAVFSALIVLVLGLGIGANTAVFRIVHEVILKPLPFRDPARLIAVWDTYVPQFSKIGVSPVELNSWRQQGDLFEETAWYRDVPLDGTLALPGAVSIAAHADFISSNLFSMLGVTPLHGRAFSSKEDPHSVLLSHRLWQAHFASDPWIIGRGLHFNGESLTIVGIMPAEAQLPEWADLWLPQGPTLGDELTNPVRHAVAFLARLRPGIRADQASQHLLAISKRLAAEHPTTSTGWGIRAANLQADLTGGVRPTLLLLLGASSLLLLIACANIASLLLSRASARAKEMAIRAAIGASSARIVQQLVTENLVLALFGGALGWLLAKAGLLLVVPARATMEPAVLLALLAASLVTGVFFGLAPAIHALRTDSQSVIKSAAVTGRGGKTRSALVVFEFALTLTLVIGAAILAKSFIRLMQVNPGFNPAGVLTFRILTPPSRKPEALFHRFEEKLQSVLGVETVARTNSLPLIADRAFTSRFNVPGSPVINPDALPSYLIKIASPAYFRAMQIPLRSGRPFEERDLNQSVVIVNETMAKRFWPDRNPVGVKFITGPWGPNPTWSTIVGVAADVKEYGLDSEPGFEVYYPSLGGQYLIIKTDDLPTLARTIEQTIHSIDPELAVSDIRSMQQIAAESARTRRWTMGLLATFASLAFLLALVGIYGVISWTVAQRTREVGIRMALGAQQPQVVAMVLSYGVKLSLAGLALGVSASFALRRTLGTLVYDVSTGDPIIYLVVPAVMFTVALLACYIPARKAARVDPLIALRYD